MDKLKATRIEDYALIGDCHSGALVSRTGSIDWLCLPRFDSSALFASLLGTPEHGHWRISPGEGIVATRRGYIGESMVLETIFETPTGSCRIVDCMSRKAHQPDLLRVVEGLSGTVELELELVIRFEYGSVVPWLTRTGPGSFHAIGGPDAVAFQSAIEVKNENLRTYAKFSVRAGERVPFVLTWYPSHQELKRKPIDAWKVIQRALRGWKDWASRCEVRGPGRATIVRSLLTLKALTYAPTGGITAALTTSLPERVGGVRNWDYRFCWVRDSTFTLYSLMLGGYKEEARAWVDWLIRAVAGTPAQVNIMYGIAGERRLTEIELDWLPGFLGSRPVRIGNAAYKQAQLDIFGELMDTIWIAIRGGIEFDRETWPVLLQMMEHVETVWSEADHGIWEMRGPKRHFTHSKVMAWVAFDRAIKIARRKRLDGPLERWRELRKTIHREICERGYDEKKGSFTQTYGGKEVDASLLMLALVGFLPASDPRIRSTVETIERELLRDGLVMRYRATRSHDGLPGREGVFIPCSFWLLDNYLLLGRHDDASWLFSRLLSLRNDVGLLSEEFDSARGMMLGNFPQAFSHVSLVNSALHFYTGQSPVIDRGKESQYHNGESRERKIG